ncbi:type VI immunity family protein [Cystobacter fuscus]|uniref:type VI immunity family protein n=1 Tax=Cystobacter fuscus TaxID=43 RepID=UPI0037BE48BB
MSERYPVVQVRGIDGQLTVQDGLILCFFMRHKHKEIAQKVWHSLQIYLRSIPTEALAWYVSPEGDTLPLNEQGWMHIREKILDRPWAQACHVQLLQQESGAGGYNFEYDGYEIDPLCDYDEKAACAIAFSLPTEYLLEHGADKVRALALELSRDLPFSFGYASLAFVAPSGQWYSVRRALLPLLERYWGFDLYHLGTTSRVIGTGARGAYWLTFLGEPLLSQLGGLEVLRRELAFPEVSFEPLDGGRLLLTLGEWPSPMDIREHINRPHFRALAHLLEPYFPEEKIGLTSLLDNRNMGRWLRRFCL